MEIGPPLSMTAPFGSHLMGDVILNPGPHDVLLGRGGGTNNYCGNIKFRKLVNEHKMRYLTCSKVEKPNVAREVVQMWRKLTPPGRFLAKHDDGKKKKPDKDKPREAPEPPAVWVEVGDKKAREKASQCLRERTPDVLPLLRHMREQQDSSKSKSLTLVASSSQPVSPLTPKKAKAKAKADDKLDMPSMPRQSKPARAKRPAKPQGQPSKSQANKQARSMTSRSPNQGSSPTQLGHPRVVDLSPPSQRALANASRGMQMGMMGPGVHLDVPLERAISRRNTMPDCGPHHQMFWDRRGSLPTMPGGSSDVPQSGMGNPGLGMPYTPNASAMMQMGRGRPPASAAGSRLGGMGAAMGGNFPIPGQGPVSPMEAEAFRNAASPYLDLYDPSCPLGGARYQQHQLRLHHLKLEQEHLQQQLEDQLHMEMEMRYQRPMGAGAAMSGQHPGMAYPKHQSAPDLMFHHEQAAFQHQGRGVEAPGYLHARTGMDPLLLQAQAAHADQAQFRERSDPPTEPFNGHSHGPLDHPTPEQAFKSTKPESKEPANLGQVLQKGPHKVSPEMSKDVLHELPTTPRQTHQPAQQRKSTLEQRSPRNETSSDPDGEMTLAEYRRSLDAYVTNNNITITDQIYSDDDNDHDGPGTADDLSVRSFGEWRDGASEQSRNESLRPDPPARDGEPGAAIARGDRIPVPHIPRGALRRQNSSGHSVMSASARTVRSSFTSLSGISMLSAPDSELRGAALGRPDDGSMADATGDGKLSKNFSSNESVVSEITVISHTIDGLGLDDDDE